MTVSYTVAGSFVTSTGGQNGATVDAWKASRFSGVPALNSSPPAGSADAGPVTTSNSFGSLGAFQIACPTNEQYYIRIQYSGTIYWQRATPVVNTDGISGGEVDSGRLQANMLTASGFIGRHPGGHPPNGTYNAYDWSVDDTSPGLWITPGGGVNPSDWINISGASGSGSVSSVFGRAGAVSASVGDYTAAKVTNAADKSSTSTQAFSGPISSAGSISSSASIQATQFTATGLTGYANPATLAGSTVSGAPSSGRHVLGEITVDQTGITWICTVTGTPGTWVSLPTGSGTTLPLSPNSPVTGNSYTLQLNDLGCMLETTSNASVGTIITIPTNASVGFPTSGLVYVCQIGTSQAVFSPINGTVTLKYTTSASAAHVNSTMGIRQRGTVNTWVTFGDVL